MNWLSQCREWVRKYDPVRPDMLAGELHHYGFMRRLSELLPANAIIVSDTGGNVIMMGHCFQSKAGQRIFSSSGNSPMGFSLCGSIGAWFADPSRPIVCICGDGGFQLNAQEQQTVKHYGVKIKVFIINNMQLGNTAAYQIQNGKKPLACGPDGYSAPDFCKIATAYGIRTERIITVDDYALIDSIMAADEPVICDVQHPYFCDYKPRMSVWSGGVEEMFPPLPEEELLGNMNIPLLDGWQDRRKQYKDLGK